MSELEVKHPEFAKRLNKVMKLRGVDLVELSEKTKIGYEMIRRYTHGYAKPREPGLKKIADALDASIIYLNYGTGGIDKPDLASLTTQVREMEADKKHEQIKFFDDGFEVVDIIDRGYLPVISWVAAGSFSGVEAVTLNDIVEDSPKVKREAGMSDKAFGLVVKGRSMAPDFLPGDIIHVEPEITPWDLKDGDKVVVQCEDGHAATFKQIIIGDSVDDMYLKPLNPDWHEQKIIPLGECTLVGKVLFSTRKH